MMRAIFPVLLFCAIAAAPGIAGAQVHEYITPPDSYPIELAPPPEPDIYRCVEQMPRFKGDLNSFLKDNMRYSDSSKDSGEEGRVVMQCVIESTGLVNSIKVARSCGYPALDLEAVRMIRLMELQAYWEPGRQNGKPVPVYFTLPVIFRLE